MNTQRKRQLKWLWLPITFLVFWLLFGERIVSLWVRKLLLVVGLFCLGAAGYGLPHLIVTSADSLTCWSRGAYSNGDGTCGEKFAQQLQKPSEPKPEAKTLGLEASQQWMEAQRQINELQLKIDNLRLQQTVIALGEGVPKGYVVGGRDDQGRIFYVPAPKAKP